MAVCDCDVGCAERCDHVAAVTVGLEHDCVTVFAANSNACDSDRFVCVTVICVCVCVRVCQ